jgi:acyl carrier protein
MTKTIHQAKQGLGRDLVVEFLLARRPELGTIDPDFDLIENRVLDSLGFVNFLYVLEEQTGREISLDQASPEDFRTLRKIRERFPDDIVSVQG